MPRVPGVCVETGIDHLCDILLSNSSWLCVLTTFSLHCIMSLSFLCCVSINMYSTVYGGKLQLQRALWGQIYIIIVRCS